MLKPLYVLLKRIASLLVLQARLTIKQRKGHAVCKSITRQYCTTNVCQVPHMKCNGMLMLSVQRATVATVRTASDACDVSIVATSCARVGTSSGSKSAERCGSIGTQTLPVFGCTQNGACTRAHNQLAQLAVDWSAFNLQPQACRAAASQLMRVQQLAAL
jgi:hypothetical protein